MPVGRGGKISHRLNPKNTGLRHQWFQACYPATDDGSYCLIVEDDLELSPFWFTWLRKAWLKYGDRNDIAGITLSVSFESIRNKLLFDIILKRYIILTI